MSRSSAVASPIADWRAAGRLTARKSRTAVQTYIELSPESSWGIDSCLTGGQSRTTDRPSPLPTGHPYDSSQVCPHVQRHQPLYERHDEGARNVAGAGPHRLPGNEAGTAGRGGERAPQWQLR